MDLSPEEIERNQNALHFRSDVVKKNTVILWKLKEMRSNWPQHFSGAAGTHLKIPINVGDNKVVKMHTSISIVEGQFEFENEFRFVFKPDKGGVPKLVESLYGKYLFEFLDRDGNVWQSRESGVVNWLHNFDAEPGIDFNPYYDYGVIPVNTLLSDLVLGDSDSLTIRITFTHHTCRTLDYPNTQLLHDEATNSVQSILSQQMESLLQETGSMDIQLNAIGGFAKAHKLILGARSPVFKRMFEAEFVEKSGEVEITDLSLQTVEIIIYYVYTGKLREDWKNPKIITEILNAANRYDLQGLMDYCDKLMITFCNEVNAQDLLSVAELHGLLRAAADIQNYMRGITM